MENGNLTTFLEQNPSASRIHLVSILVDTISRVPPSLIVESKMHDTASALQHIHAMDIVHSDIKAVRSTLIGFQGS
jgi:serine/threonine protein kinase